MEDNFKLSFNQVNKLVKYIEAMGEDTEIEEPSILYSDLIEKFIKVLNITFSADKYTKVLDVGCGSGVALKEVAKYG